MKEESHTQSHQHSEPTNVWLVPLSIILAALIVSAAVLYGFGNVQTTLKTGLVAQPAANPGTGNTAPIAVAPTAPAPTASADFSAYTPRLVTGQASAQVVVVEFSDFQCPFCERAYSDAVKGIKQDYVTTGKVQFAYEEFPLESIHPNARPAAEAAECAAEQNKFWEYHDKLYQNQQSLSDASYKQWAADLGLNTSQFNSCVDTKKFAQKVTDGVTLGQQKGVSGTPTFFIYKKGKANAAVKIVGAQPYATVKAAIDSALAS
ncbi:MAG: DsbA family protein [Candidatus Micrarchaeota archaeon]